VRYIFGKTLAQLAEKDPLIHVLVGDIGFGVFDDFRKIAPNRFINVGTIEQSMISIAAGMALKGLKPWVFTITPFLIERAFEQIKIDIAVQSVDVKLVGYADYPEQGITHQELDGPRLINIIPDFKSYFPKSKEEVISAIIDSYNLQIPTFISLKKL
jgi:transketolase